MQLFHFYFQLISFFWTDWCSESHFLCVCVFFLFFNLTKLHITNSITFFLKTLFFFIYCCIFSTHFFFYSNLFYILNVHFDFKFNLNKLPYFSLKKKQERKFPFHILVLNSRKNKNKKKLQIKGEKTSKFS